MKKAVVFLVSLISLFGVVSCEKEAETSDFFPPEIFENLISGDNPATGNENIPSVDNPILIGEINGEDFKAISADINQRTIRGIVTLSMLFTDVNGNIVQIIVQNPESRTYEIGGEDNPDFEANFLNNSLNENFTTRESVDSKSSMGIIDLNYTIDTGFAKVSAQFNFKAFLITEIGISPSKFVDFKKGNVVKLPVVFN